MKSVVAGGCGLIGREIVRQMRFAGADVKSLDVNPNADIVADLTNTDFNWADGLNVFVNASYPSHPEDHFRAFLDASDVVASRMVYGDVIINISSVYGVIGSKVDMYSGTEVEYTPVGYSAAKGAIISLTRAIACKYGRNGVRANCISPGGVFDGHQQSFIDKYMARVPLRVMVSPVDVANAVVFLASDKARFITGQNLVVDGGLTIQ